MDQGELYRAVSDATADCLYAKDRDGRYRMANRATATLFGRPVEEVLGRDDAELFGPEAGARIVARDREVMETGGALTYHDTVTAPVSGITRTFLTTKEPLRDPHSGDIVGVIGVSRDVTWLSRARADRERAARERDAALASLRAANDALKVSEARFRVALDASAVTVVECDAEGRYTYLYNPRLRPADQTLGRTDQDLFPGPVGEQLLAWKLGAIRSGIGSQLDTVVADPESGRPRHYRLACEPRRDRFGAVIGLTIAAEEVTAQREADAALRASEARYKAFTERGRDLVTLLDRDGIIRYQSESVRAVLGHSPAALIGASLLVYVHPDDVALGMATLARVASGEAGVAPVTLRVRHADGTWRHLESVGTDATANPAVGGIVVNSRDVSERVRLQNQLIQSGKLAALGELAAGVAHEVNNPLAAISGMAQLLAMHPDPVVREAVSEDAAAIRSLVDRAARIIASLKMAARSGGGAAAAERVPVSLEEVLASALDIVGHRLRRAGIELRLCLAPDLPDALADFGEIERVLVNLLTNAEQAITGEGEEGGGEAARPRVVTVRTGVGGPSAADGRPRVCVLTITDTGPGIPPAILPRIFDPFFSTRQQGEGTGLGLYLAYGSVSAHGGTLSAENAPEGGARFTLTLPVAPPTDGDD